MKTLLIVMVLVLLVPVVCSAKAFGPLWAVWTHSEVACQCAAKTGFWWIGGWMLAIHLYDRHVRVVPTTKADVVRRWREREKLGPNR